MSNQTCKAKVGAVDVEVNFDYTEAQPECGVGANADIDKVIVLNEGGFLMGDIAGELDRECLARLQQECYKFMGHA